MDPGIIYGDLGIEWFHHPAGYGAISDECRRPLKERRLAKTIANWIKALPSETHVIVWTFKQRHQKDHNIPQILADTLAEHGVDRDRLTVVTHGSSKGSNAFEYAEATAFYGVFQKDKLVVAGEAIGETGDLETDLSSLSDIHFSEIVHELYQEISRSNVRNINLGRAGSARVFLPICRDNIPERLIGSGVFPRAALTRRPDLQKRGGRPASKTALAVVKARELLENIDAQSISSPKLHSLGFDVTEDMWKGARREFELKLEYMGFWKDKSTYRVINPFEGCETETGG